MRRSVIFLICGWLLSTAGIFSQQTTYEDVIFLKDGSVIRGQIIEQKIGEYVRLVMNNGREIKLLEREIDRMDKEKAAIMSKEHAITSSEKSATSHSTKQKSWYIFSELMIGSSIVPNVTQEWMDQMDKQSPVFDLKGGAYWPLKDKRTILGLAASLVGFGSYDKYYGWYNLNYMTTMLSAKRFIHGEIGNGPFAGAELGMSILQEGWGSEKNVPSTTGIHIGLNAGYVMAFPWSFPKGTANVGLTASVSTKYFGKKSYIAKGFYTTFMAGLMVDLPDFFFNRENKSE